MQNKLNDRMKNFLTDLAVLIKTHNITIESDNCDGSLWLNDQTDKNGQVDVNITSGILDIESISEVLEDDENPKTVFDRNAKNINQVSFNLYKNNMVNQTFDTYRWVPKGVSMDSGYLSVEIKVNGMDVNAKIIKNGFVEVTEDELNFTCEFDENTTAYHVFVLDGKLQYRRF